MRDMPLLSLSQHRRVEPLAPVTDRARASGRPCPARPLVIRQRGTDHCSAAGAQPGREGTRQEHAARGPGHTAEGVCAHPPALRRALSPVCPR